MSVDVRQSGEYKKFMTSLDWKVEKGMFIKKLPLIPFSFVKYQRTSWPIDFKMIEKVCKKHRGILLKIELDELVGFKFKDEVIRQGFRENKSPMLPTKTVWIDLKKSEEQLLREMHYKTRYNLKRYQGQKVEIVRGDRITDDALSSFDEVYKNNSKSQGFWGLSFGQLKSLLKAFGKKSYLLQARDKGGLVLLIHDKVAYYSHNGSTTEGRKMFVPTRLTWEAIRLAKKLKCVRFDFEGVSDSRFKVTDRWKGFSRFKKGFGGKVVEYVSSYHKWRVL